jgi:hypothetical protein
MQKRERIAKGKKVLLNFASAKAATYHVEVEGTEKTYKRKIKSKNFYANL